MSEKLEELNVTKEEVEKIGEALKNKEFRKLFAEYCEEITNPESQKQYEEEITQLEKERGVEVIFIHPNPVYVIKTSVGGNKIAFINVCGNENVGKPSAKSVVQNGSCGNNWSIPHLLSPPREDFNKKRKHCTVYDVIFHPESIERASKNKEFRDFINNIACEAVESNYNVKLDRTNLKFPKIKYKGYARPLVIRKKTKSFVEIKPDDPIDHMYSEMYKSIDEKSNYNKKAKETILKESENMPKYQKPKYIIKQSSQIEMDNFTYHTTSKINATIPKELVIEIDLPLLKTSSNLILDVTNKSLNLKSEKPAKYQLDLNLPYEVNENLGNAKFDQDTKQLKITLPVSKKYNKSIVSESTHIGSNVKVGELVEKENNSTPLITLIETESETSEIKTEKCNPDVTPTTKPFIDPESHYVLPNFTCKLSNNNLLFTLYVRNVVRDSLHKIHNDDITSIHIKFTSMSPAYVPINYALYLYIPSFQIDINTEYIKIRNNCVVMKIKYFPEQTPITTYWVGVSEESIKEQNVEVENCDENDDDDDDADNSLILNGVEYI